MDMYVVCERRDGKGSRAATAITEAAADQGIATIVRSIDEAVPDDMVAADVLVIGCRLQTNTPYLESNAGEMSRWIAGLPNFDGQPIGVFCSFSFFPHSFADVTARTSKVLNNLSESFRFKGGNVVAAHALHLRELQNDAAKFVSELAGSVAE